MNVEYGAVDLQRAPLDESLRPVLANLFDLHAEFIHYLSPDEMNQIAQHMMQIGATGGQVQVPAGVSMPQASYAAPPQGLQPMQPPPQPYGAPPAAPQAAPPPQAAPQALPPAGAPGGLPQGFSPGAAPPASHPGVPPTSPPAPGLPGGFESAPAAPPVMTPPAAAPPPQQGLTGGQTPEEFEASLANKPGQPPF